MRFSLMVVQGSGQGKEIPVNKAEFTIGRDAGCNLRPASQHVSKRHCALRVRGEQVFIEDFKSTNGTFVNDEQLQGEREIHDGDRVKVGPLDFVVKLEGAQAEKPTQVEKETQATAAAAKAPATAPKAAAPPKAPAKPAPAAKPHAQPKPAAGKDAKAVEALDEDAIGSMLLSLSDEQGDVNDSDSFAQGSTVMQVLKPEEIEQLQNAGNNDKTPYRPKPSNQGTNANSSQAAKAILEKYRRRPKS